MDNSSKINAGYLRSSDYDHRKLVSAFLRQLKRGHDDVCAALHDICEHGMNAGWSGFVYYDDIRQFFERHEDAIMQVLYDLCASMGETLMQFTANCSPDVETLDGIRCLWVWTACEEIARNLTEFDAD